MLQKCTFEGGKRLLKKYAMVIQTFENGLDNHSAFFLKKCKVSDVRLVPSNYGHLKINKSSGRF